MQTKFFFLILLIAPLALTFQSCDDDDDTMEMSMLDVLKGDDRFTTLVSALEQTGLDGTVNILDDATLFAPTDDAFANSGIDLAALSDEELSSVLLYHLVPAEIESSDIDAGQTYVSSFLAGPDNQRPGVSILVERDIEVKVNGAEVVEADIDTDLGVIHAINGVLLPLDIVGHATTNENFDELVGALGLASEDLVSVLQGDGPFTVFAPVNSAFEEIAGVVSGLSPEQVTEVLLYHVVSGAQVFSDQLTDGQEVTSANEHVFTVNLGSEVTLTDTQGNEATVILTDVQATNGVIHVLDKVIIPEL